MKKVLSLVLCLAMVFSLSVIAFAAETTPTGNYAAGTTVTYSEEATEAYSVTVPATLTPGGSSGTVSVAGKWASNRVVKVSAPTSVILKNSINESDTKDPAITFTAISKTGSNTVEITGEEADAKSDISVTAIYGALFGTWSGTINYTVSIEDATATA